MHPVVLSTWHARVGSLLTARSSHQHQVYSWANLATLVHPLFIAGCYNAPSPEFVPRAPCDRETLPCSRSQETIMEKAYWLSRKRASLKLAQGATSSEARLAHYELAGRYSVKATSAETQAIDLAASLPPSILDLDVERTTDS